MTTPIPRKTHKTAELTGVMLDIAVAKAEGVEYRLEVWPTMPPRPAQVVLIRDGRPDFQNEFRPHEDGRIVMFVLGREKLKLEPFGDEWLCAKAGEGGTSARAKDPREAVLRVFVTLKLGETVELP